MNSAVEPLLKAINDLSERVSMLEAEKGELIRRISNIECDITGLQGSIAANNYRWDTTINTGTYTPYGRSITDGIGNPNYISDLTSNNDGTFTLTYSNGTTVTLGN